MLMILFIIAHKFMNQLMTADGITFACRGEIVTVCGNSTKMARCTFTPEVYAQDTP